MQANDVISYLTLVESFYNKYNHICWKCKCVCGKIVERRQDYLKKVKGLEIRESSCGCKHPFKTSRKGNKHPGWRGVGTLGSQYLSEIKNRALKAGRAFDVDVDYLWCLYLEQAGRCKLTGLDIEFCCQRQRHDGNEQTASLDRINSDYGYIHNNVQWVHKDVNMMKKDYTQDRFIEICRLVSRNMV